MLFPQISTQLASSQVKCFLLGEAFLPITKKSSGAAPTVVFLDDSNNRSASLRASTVPAPVTAAPPAPVQHLEGAP